MNPLRIFSLLLLLHLNFGTIKAQVKGLNLEDTTYYNMDWKKCKLSYAKYYRPPVIIESNHYKVEYRRMDNSLLQKKQ